MADSDPVIRFAVGAPSAPRSSVYRFWMYRSGSGHTDLYLTVRRMGEEFKLSLHEARPDLPARAHISVGMKTQRVVGLADRFLHVWPRQDSVDRLVNEFHVICPTAELRTDDAEADEFNNVRWIEPAPPAGAVEFIIVSGPSDENAQVHQANGRSVLGTFPLPGSRSCWLLQAAHSNLPDDVATKLKAAKSRVQSTAPTFTIGDVDLFEPGTRSQFVMARDGIPIGWIDASFVPPAA